MARSTPAELGYRLAADSRPAARFWLAWPNAAQKDALEVLPGLASLLAEQAPVTVIANPTDAPEASLSMPSGVGTLTATQNGARLKAEAPLFLIRPDDGGLAALVNPASSLEAVVEHLDCPIFAIPSWLRADFVDADGSGVLLASSHMLAEGPVEEIERQLKGLTGSERIVWLETGIPGNDGSLAAVARCLSPGVVMAGFAEDPAHPAFACLAENLQRLDAAGMTTLRLPAPLCGAGLPEAHSAAIVTSGQILLPAFGSGRDRLAADSVGLAVTQRKLALEPLAPALRRCCELSALVMSQPRR